MRLLADGGRARLETERRGLKAQKSQQTCPYKEREESRLQGLKVATTSPNSSEKRKRPYSYHLCGEDDNVLGERQILDTLSWTGTGGVPWERSTVVVYGRKVCTPQHYNGFVLWNFETLVGSFGPADYITMASSYHTFIIDKVPALTILHKNEARRFITFLDALYEARCKLVIRAENLPDDLFFPEIPTASQRGRIRRRRGLRRRNIFRNRGGSVSGSNVPLQTQRLVLRHQVSHGKVRPRPRFRLWTREAAHRLWQCWSFHGRRRTLCVQAGHLSALGAVQCEVARSDRGLVAAVCPWRRGTGKEVMFQKLPLVKVPQVVKEDTGECMGASKEIARPGGAFEVEC